MKATGYMQNSEKDLELKEVTLECNANEIDKLITFLKITKERHEYFADSGEIVHTHYRDWDKEWDCEDLDLVIVTNSEGVSK